MNFLFKFYYNLHRRLLLKGIILSLPKIFFQNSNKSFSSLAIKLRAHKSFSYRERKVMNKAIKDINYFCNKSFIFTITFDLEDLTENYSDSTVLIWKVNQNNKIIQDFKFPNVLGAFVDGTPDHILLVYDRLKNLCLLHTTFLHELGHFLGLKHESGNCIMNAIISNQLYFNLSDAEQFASIYNCNAVDLNYFKY